MAKKRKPNNKKKEITNELNKFIKENKKQILERAKDDLGNVDDKKIISLFKANFRERMKDKKETLGNAREQLKKTLHTETFTGRKQIEFENIRSSLLENNAWDTFRKLNRHQKINIDQFSTGKAPANTNVKKRWLYNIGPGRYIYIDLLYYPDGSYAWDLHK